MTRDHFAHALKLRLGRAILHARSHDVSEFQDLILNACLRCQAYDVQTEGSGAGYTYELIHSLPERAFYRQQILDSLPTAGDNDDGQLRFELAANFASDGDEEAKQTMYAAYQPGPLRGEAIGLAFVQLDRMSGFLHVARKIGALLSASMPDVDTGLLLSVATEELGEQAVLSALADAAATDENLAAFQREARESEQASLARPKFAAFSYAEVLAQPRTKIGDYRLRRWGRNAPEAEILKAAHGLLAAVDEAAQTLHVLIFSDRAFPLDPTPLLALAHHRGDLGRFAVQALSQLTDPRLRPVAFRLVEEASEQRHGAIAMLDRNFQPGDHHTALTWFEGEEEEYFKHHFGCDLRDFVKHHPDPEWDARLMLSLYELGPCSFCRSSAVRKLLKSNALPDAIRTECAWDCDDQTRDLVKPPATA